MQPLKISAETALKLSAALKVPVEQLMHMPQHILLQKLAELSKEPGDAGTAAKAKSAPEES